jgi:hypothetical protein
VLGIRPLVRSCRPQWPSGLWYLASSCHVVIVIYLLSLRMYLLPKTSRPPLVRLLLVALFVRNVGLLHRRQHEFTERWTDLADLVDNVLGLTREESSSHLKFALQLLCLKRSAHALVWKVKEEGHVPCPRRRPCPPGPCFATKTRRHRQVDRPTWRSP